VLAHDLEPGRHGATDALPRVGGWVGNHHLAGGKRIRVWTCEGHLEGVERPERVDHR